MSTVRLRSSKRKLLFVLGCVAIIFGSIKCFNIFGSHGNVDVVATKASSVSQIRKSRQAVNLSQVNHELQSVILNGKLTLYCCFDGQDVEFWCESEKGRSYKHAIYASKTIYEHYEKRATVYLSTSNNCSVLELTNFQYNDGGFYWCFKEGTKGTKANEAHVIPYVDVLVGDRVIIPFKITRPGAVEWDRSESISSPIAHIYASGEYYNGFRESGRFYANQSGDIAQLTIENAQLADSAIYYGVEDGSWDKHLLELRVWLPPSVVTTEGSHTSSETPMAPVTYPDYSSSLGTTMAPVTYPDYRSVDTGEPDQTLPGKPTSNDDRVLLVIIGVSLGIIFTLAIVGLVFCLKKMASKKRDADSTSNHAEQEDLILTTSM